MRSCAPDCVACSMPSRISSDRRGSQRRRGRRAGTPRPARRAAARCRDAGPERDRRAARDHCRVAPTRKCSCSRCRTTRSTSAQAFAAGANGLPAEGGRRHRARPGDPRGRGGPPLRASAARRPARRGGDRQRQAGRRRSALRARARRASPPCSRPHESGDREAALHLDPHGGDPPGADHAEARAEDAAPRSCAMRSPPASSTSSALGSTSGRSRGRETPEFLRNGSRALTDAAKPDPAETVATIPRQRRLR